MEKNERFTWEKLGETVVYVALALCVIFTVFGFFYETELDEQPVTQVQGIVENHEDQSSDS